MGEALPYANPKQWRKAPIRPVQLVLSAVSFGGAVWFSGFVVSRSGGVAQMFGCFGLFDLMVTIWFLHELQVLWPRRMVAPEQLEGLRRQLLAHPHTFKVVGPEVFDQFDPGYFEPFDTELANAGFVHITDYIDERVAELLSRSPHVIRAYTTDGGTIGGGLMVHANAKGEVRLSVLSLVTEFTDGLILQTFCMNPPNVQLDTPEVLTVYLGTNVDVSEALAHHQTLVQGNKTKGRIVKPFKSIGDIWDFNERFRLRQFAALESLDAEIDNDADDK